MGRRGNTVITIVIAVCIAINIATIIVFNHRLNQIKSNIPYLLQDEKIDYFSLMNRDGDTIDHLTLERDNPYLIFIFSTPCNPCNKNLPFWNSVTEIFKNKVKSIGVILDDPNTAFEFEDKANLNFPIYIPEDVQKFRQKMRIHLNMAQTVFYANGVQYHQLGILEPERVTALCNLIKSTNPED